MRNVRNASIIQIDVTNSCKKSCSNCTRFHGHYTNNRIYYMNLEYFEHIVISFKDFGGVIGIMGGEPTLHPNIIEMCEILKKHRPEQKKREIWSSNPDIFNHISPTYFDKEHVCFNPHNEDINDYRAPLLVSSESVKKKYNISQEQIDEFIDNCWIQNHWSPSVNPKGGYFCEVAAMLAYLFNGPHGFNIYEHPNWWNYDLKDFQYQIDWACKRCGAAMPLKSKPSSIIEDDISEDMLIELKKINSPKIKNNKYVLYNEPFDVKDLKTDGSWNYIEYFENKYKDNTKNSDKI